MAEMLLDATVFIDYRGGDAGARAIFQRVIEGEIKASVSPVTVFELWGRAGFDRDTEMGYFGMLTFLEEAPLSLEAAKVAGRWLASTGEEERESLGRVALVAATARERGEKVCTRNLEAYARFYAEAVDY